MRTGLPTCPGKATLIASPACRCRKMHKRQGTVTVDTPTDKIDTSVPHSARIWNYWLGGKDNFAVDRAAGDQYRAASSPARRRRPGLAAVPGPRGQLPGRRGRASGSSSTSAPACRRPTTPTRSRSGSPRRADRLRRQRPAGPGARPGAAHRHAGGRDRLHRRRPARPGPDPRARPRGRSTSPADRAGSSWRPRPRRRRRAARAIIVRRLVDAAAVRQLPVAQRRHQRHDRRRGRQGARRLHDSGAVPYRCRTPDEIAGFFDGLELVEPGVVSVPALAPGARCRAAGRRRLRRCRPQAVTAGVAPAVPRA